MRPAARRVSSKASKASGEASGKASSKRYVARRIPEPRRSHTAARCASIYSVAISDARPIIHGQLTLFGRRPHNGRSTRGHLLSSGPPPVAQLDALIVDSESIVNR